jgi:hypothetical protein
MPDLSPNRHNSVNSLVTGLSSGPQRGGSGGSPVSVRPGEIRGTIGW